MEMLLMNSDEPFTHARSRILPSKRHLPSRRILLFFLAKYSSGTPPPTTWLRAVATAAPASLYSCGREITSTASSTMFVMPDRTVTPSPSFGFSAVTQKD